MDLKTKIATKSTAVTFWVGVNVIGLPKFVEHKGTLSKQQTNAFNFKR